MKEKIINSFYLLGSSFLGQLLAKPWKGDACILMYHRVLKDDVALEDKTSIAIGESIFEEQIKYLSENFCVVSMDELCDQTFNSHGKPVVALTFDDGYIDNLEIALPILEKYQTPATVYSVTRFLDGDCEMWWYELFEILENNDELFFDWGGEHYSWDLSTIEDELICYKMIREMMIGHCPKNQGILMGKIRGDREKINYVDEVMNRDQLKCLNNSPLITIGAHTQSHGVLSQMEETEIVEDILNSKKKLEELLGEKVEHFAYPFGSEVEASSREYQIVSKLDFKSVVTTKCSPLHFEVGRQSCWPRVTVKSRTKKSHLKAKIGGWNSLFGGVQI